MSQLKTSRRRPAWGEREWFAQRFHTDDLRDPFAYYAHAANGYQLFRHQVLARFAAKSLAGHRVDRFLDVGCGTGELTALIARLLDVRTAAGVDFVEQVAAEAQRRFPDIAFTSGALPVVDFPPESFDLVLASEVLYYLGKEDRHQAVRHLAEVLAPGGHLLFTARIGANYFTPQEAADLLQTEFDIESTWFFHGVLYHWTGLAARGVRAAHEFAAHGVLPSHQGLAARFRRAGVLMRNPVFRGIASVGASLATCWTRSTLAPAACNWFARLAAPRAARTNIAILARRKDAAQ